MAAMQTGGGISNSIKEYQGLSTDTKPMLTAENSGSSFLCVDTGDVYDWHVDTWYKL